MWYIAWADVLTKKGFNKIDGVKILTPETRFLRIPYNTIMIQDFKGFQGCPRRQLCTRWDSTFYCYGNEQWWRKKWGV